MNGQTFYAITHPRRSDTVSNLQLAFKPGQYNQALVICLENESNSETHLHV